MFNYVDLAGGVVVLVMLVVAVVLHKRRPGPKLNKLYYQRRWSKLQKLCSDNKLWYQAIIDADLLLDEALKQRHFKGKTTGERLVSAQHQFSSNDAIWLSHKLRNKITEQEYRKLSKKQTLEALAAFRSALKDIGALGAEGRTKSSNGR